MASADSQETRSNLKLTFCQERRYIAYLAAPQ
jgi:hypothetical protein